MDNRYNCKSFVTPLQPPTLQQSKSVEPPVKDTSGVNSSWLKSFLLLD